MTGKRREWKSAHLQTSWCPVGAQALSHWWVHWVVLLSPFRAFLGAFSPPGRLKFSGHTLQKDGTFM